MTDFERGGEEPLPDDLLAPEGADDVDPPREGEPGIEGEEHFGLTPPG